MLIIGINNKNLLSGHRHGYRKGLGTVTDITDYVHYVLGKLYIGELVLEIFLDLS